MIVRMAFSLLNFKAREESWFHPPFSSPAGPFRWGAFAEWA
jgi:hypothetical protein